MRKAFLIPAVVLAALAMSGCTKCGWIWDQGPHACHSDTVR
jgi:outer membrane murein-binding lipoprotein Lpp